MLLFKRIVYLLLFVLTINTGCNSSSKNLFVASDGDDNNTGSVEQPMKTIKAAVAKAKNGAFTTIQIRKGNYYLDEPIVLTKEHAGTEKQPFTIKAYQKETVSISGGQALKLDWQPYKGKILQAKVPKGLLFEQLFVNGTPQIKARYPNFDPKIHIFNGYAADAISPERVAKWNNPIGAYVHAMHVAHWGGYHYQVKGIKENGELDLIGGYQNNRQMGMHKDYRFVEGIFEELDAPKEWFLDEKNSMLYWYPDGHVDEKQALIEIAVLKHLFEIRGEKEAPAQYISIEDLEMKHTAYTFMESKEPLLRSDWAIYRGGAILIENAENCQINRNHFKELGGNAVFVNNYNRKVAINSNHFEYIGASAICFVGDPNAVRSPSFEYHQFVEFGELDRTKGPKTDNYPAQCIAYDNLIHDIGLVEKQTAGVQISMAMDIKVDHNTIYRLPRAGINISEGTWGGHIIENNEVFETVLETGDHGAFNSWGRDRFWHPNRGKLDEIVAKEPSLIKLDAIHTTIIRNNRFHCDHGWDIDLDDGSSNYHIYNNVCLSGGLKLREGFYRTVENNIMLNNTFHPHVWFKDCGDIFRRNIVMTSYKAIRLDGFGAEIDHNFFPDSVSLVTSQAAMGNQDKNALFGNPMFIAPEEGNYQLNAASPVLKLGFKNFPMDKFGVVTPSLKALAEQPPIPTLVRQDFQVKKQKTFDLLGMTIKNIEGLGERSAAGLNDENGVLIMDLEEEGAAKKSGLKKGDVIVKCGEMDIKNIQTLYDAYQGEKWKGHLKLILIRNQAAKQLSLSIR